MLKSLLESSALPNLHPALVHFPIALLFVALLADLAALVLPRPRGPGRAAAALWLLAALGALASYRSGRQAQDGLGLLAPEVMRAVDAHADWAWRAAWALGAVAGLRAAVVLLGERRPAAGRAALALLVVGGGGSAAWLLLGTADRGGALVYRHGVSVAAVLRASGGAAAASAPSGAGPAPGYLLERGGARVRATAEIEEGEGGWIAAAGDDGRMRLALPAASSRLRLVGRDDVGDAAVEVDFEIEAPGAHLALLHHLYDGGVEDALVLEGRTLRLERRGPGEPPEVLAEAEVDAGPGRHRLAVVADGKHQRGLLDGAARVHGHTTGLAGGKVGLEVAGPAKLLVHAWTVAVGASPTPGPTSR